MKADISRGQAEGTDRSISGTEGRGWGVTIELAM